MDRNMGKGLLTRMIGIVCIAGLIYMPVRASDNHVLNNGVTAGGDEQTFYGRAASSPETAGVEGEEFQGGKTFAYGNISIILFVAGAVGVTAFFFKKKINVADTPVEEVEEEDKQEEEDTDKCELWIAAIGGYMKGRVYPVEKSGISIGRNPDSVICFPKNMAGVSRVHAKLYWQEGRLMLMDCNSTSGTFLKRSGRMEPMQPEEIKDGDIFYIGEKKNSFEVKT